MNLDNAAETAARGGINNSTADRTQIIVILLFSSAQ